MNNNKDPCSNECRAHKSLFIVDWFLCPAPDECIQMEIAILCHTQHNGSYLKVMLCTFLGLCSFKRHLYHHIKCDLPFFILTNKLLFQWKRQSGFSLAIVLTIVHCRLNSQPNKKQSPKVAVTVTGDLRKVKSSITFHTTGTGSVSLFVYFLCPCHFSNQSDKCRYCLATVLPQTRYKKIYLWNHSLIL